MRKKKCPIYFKINKRRKQLAMLFDIFRNIIALQIMSRKQISNVMHDFPNSIKLAEVNRVSNELLETLKSSAFVASIFQ